jgi:hypothetical protein
MKFRYQKLETFCKERNLTLNELVQLIETKLEWLNQFQDEHQQTVEITIEV